MTVALKLLLIVLALPPAQAQISQGAAPAGEEAAAKTVRVRAEGYTAEDALRQALRKALEQGAGVQIAAYSQAENYVLIRDTIYSRAAGIVRDYRVLDSGRTDAGSYWVEIEATVRPDAVAAAWGEVQNVLDQIGRPKIMVWIDERIDGQLQPDSIVEARIEELFAKAGFDLVTRKARGSAAKAEAADVRDDSGLTELQKIARELGAHLIIRGTANADRAGIENLYGIPAAFYNCDVQARIYATATGRLIASESIPSTRRGVRSRHEYSPQAAREALVQATFPSEEAPGRQPPLAIRLYESVMEQWATQISAGGDIDLEVRNIRFKDFLELKKLLSEIEGIGSVNADFTENVAQFRLKARIDADTLAELLTRPPFSEILEITDLKPGRIRANCTKP